MIPKVFAHERMSCCDVPVQMTPEVQAPSVSEWSQWQQQFNWLNWLGLSLFVLPMVLGYIVVHAWLLQHDALLYYGSLYAQLGLLMMAWRQV